MHCTEVCAKLNPILHREQSERYAKQRESEPRICEICDKKFCRRISESRTVFKNRKTCGEKCGAAYKVKKKREEVLADTKICKNPDCKKEFTRHITSKHIESRVRFKTRETCSAFCYQKGRKANAKNRIRPKNGTVGRKRTTSLLPPPSELKVHVPDAPKPTEVRVWRPASWGGEYTRRVS